MVDTDLRKLNGGNKPPQDKYRQKKEKKYKSKLPKAFGKSQKRSLRMSKRTDKHEKKRSAAWNRPEGHEEYTKNEARTTSKI